MQDRRRERDEIKDGLKDRIADLCARLLPDGRREGRLWVANNPVTHDAPWPPVLKVALDRDVGAWKCWRSGDTGDVIGLVEYCLQTDFRGAMDFSRDFLGLRAMAPGERADFSKRNAERRVAAEQEAARRMAERIEAVRSMWSLATTIHDDGDTAAHARAYFETRGIPLDDVKTLDRQAFRVKRDLEWWKGREGNRPGPKCPAIISAFRNVAGQLDAVHCTFLDRLAPVKAAVGQPKLMFGPTKGRVIRIAMGPPLARVPLILCEGIEDGLSLAIGVPEAMVWAAGSLSNMANAPVHVDRVSAVFVAADNDWHSEQAQRQFEDVLEKIEAQGKPTEVMRSSVGKDFNDGMVE